MLGAMERQAVLEDYVVPVCSAEVRGGRATLRRLLGTAFFIDNSGVFLTARHVLQGIKESAQVEAGLNVKAGHAGAANLFAPLRGWESAPDPYDIAIGRVDFGSRCWFSVLERRPASPWKDIATLGYPETALNCEDSNFNIHLRALKGYVQRHVASGEIALIRPHPECYELNFPIASGMSGAPLFEPVNNRQELLGVCVGSYSAETTDYRSTQVLEGGNRFEERSVKVEQIGVAQLRDPLILLCEINKTKPLLEQPLAL